MHLNIGGRELSSLYITKFTPKIELLDGEGTGRTKADLWDMIRQPQGYILNFTVEIAPTLSTNQDFQHLYNTCLSLGSREFVSVSFIDPAGNPINQEMYYTLDGIDFTWVENGKIKTGPIRANFIAKRGTR
jgi:hypothetical protein